MSFNFLFTGVQIKMQTLYIDHELIWEKAEVSGACSL